MKNKLIYIFVFCLWHVHLAAQQHPDSIVKEVPTVSSQIQDNLYFKRLGTLIEKTPKDSSGTNIKLLNVRFQEKYLEDKEFDYGRQAAEYSFGKTLKAAIYKLLRSIFGLGPQISPDFITLFVRILSGIVILVVLFFAVRIYLHHKGKWLTEKTNQAIEIDVDDVEQLIQFADFEYLISDAEKMNNTRLSIRYYYLWLLKILKERNIIEWLPDKTNSDYIAEIKSREKRSQFQHLSYLYEYIWYGEFSINDHEYHTAKTAFQQFLGKGGSRG